MNKMYYHLSLDDIQMYLIHGATLHPIIHSLLLEKLQMTTASGKLSLLPLACFEMYHQRIEKLRSKSKAA